ncbi:PIR protein [Plasmodium yoelii yoelii]|uniref:PIR protein n=2 Tax=Plasmodium yoelii yoelii TaxID=73239 RepID=A0AAE9WLD7_PLAYO|nr:PIR protein [Plasmodium yoelii yoelii]
MNKTMCNSFCHVMKNFEYDSNSRNYNFKDDQHFQKYCTNNNCKTDLEKINAACLYIFNELFKDSSVFESVAKSNINIVEYIMIWLSYMLSRTKSVEKDSLNEFYTKLIENGEGRKKEIDVTACKNYKDLIDRNYYFLSIDKSIISKLYDALTSLCNMYNKSGEHETDCTKYKEYANDFVSKYEEVINDSNITKKGLYIKVLSTLSTLSTDYDNFKKKYDGSSSLPDIKQRLIYKNMDLHH